MPPVVIAFVGVVLLFVMFWMTRSIPGAMGKWGPRIVSVVVVYVLSGVLSADSRTAAVAGQYLVYFGVGAVVVYLIAGALFGGRRA
jgi:hypothetical protein